MTNKCKCSECSCHKATRISYEKLRPLLSYVFADKDDKRAFLALVKMSYADVADVPEMDKRLAVMDKLQENIYIDGEDTAMAEVLHDAIGDRVWEFLNKGGLIAKDASFLEE